MIKLHGFALSNYYNKVKLALLEKDIPFEEVLNWATKDEPTLALSPLGKVPFMTTPQGSLCESQVLVDYLEQVYPAHPLLPKDPYAAAKVRELITFLELHVELVARRLYPQAFFGKTLSAEFIDECKKDLVRGIAAFSRVAKFSPYLAGEEFTIADCAGLVHLPLVTMTSKAIYGEDMLAALPVKDYLKRLGERTTVQKVNADRKLAQELRAKAAS
jgi:glutathione S-transferase